MRASRCFSKQERRAIEAAVAEAESQTSGEIVPVVATCSGRYDRAEDLFGVVTALAAVAVVWVLFQRVETSDEAWSLGHGLVLGLGPLLLVFLLAFGAGATLASWVPVLRHPFVTNREMQEEVERAAAQAFQRFRVRRTVGGSGVLLYISLWEHMVCVLADETVSERVKQSEWEDIRDLIVDGIQEGEPVDALIAAVQRCGELLARHFPPRLDDENELTNELRLID
ncbi:MAG: hypothetical protein HUU25_09330 [Candidatus Sumerlaeia bacterium]|nr:hypothetical protein [Candidatus Sumerlaeia bacterium]